MRKLSLILSTVAALTLGGCATTGGSNSTIAQIQQIAVAACGFLPTVATVANILAAGNPLVATGEAIANAICAAVTPAKQARLSGRKMATVPMVGGVVIHGRFIN